MRAAQATPSRGQDIQSNQTRAHTQARSHAQTQAQLTDRCPAQTETHPANRDSWNHLPPSVRDSWQRSTAQELDPDTVTASVDLSDTALNDRRAQHPLALIRPVVSSLLVEPATEAGLVVALADADGTLLWVDGDSRTRSDIAAANFVEGSNWSEEKVGANAPGLALATGQGSQVRGHEHFAQAVSGYSCTAVPIFHPTTGALLGGIDITGGPAAVAQHSLPLLNAVVAAACAELLRVQADWSGNPGSNPGGASGVNDGNLGATYPGITPATEQPDSALGTSGGDALRRPVQLKVLGHGDSELIDQAGRRRKLSLRHTEILLLLALQEKSCPGSGLRTADLVTQLWGGDGTPVTLRAEIVRLRKLLAGSGLDLQSRPYRLSVPVQCDALEFLDALAACDRPRALQLAQNPLLPRSDAPRIRDVENHAHRELREMVLNDGTSEELLRFLTLPAGREDKWAHEVALRQLPPDAPERSRLVVALENWHD